MTDLTERLRGRIAEASPLPWVYRPDKYDDWGWIRGVEQESDIGRYRPVVAIAKDSNVREETFGLHRQNKTDPYGPNALLITDAVNALPELLTTLETLTQENARLREALEGIVTGDVERVVAHVWRADGKPSKLDQCAHDVQINHDCPSCIEDHARKALGGGDE